MSSESIDLEGYWHAKLDSKLRLTLPTGLQAKIPESEDRKFFLTYGIDDNFILRPASSWHRYKEEYTSNLSYNHPIGRQLLKKLTAGVTELQADSNWRINLPTRFCEKVGIQKDIVIHGFDDLVEIWDLQAYEDSLDALDAKTVAELEREYLEEMRGKKG